MRLAAFVIAGLLFLSIGTAVEARALTNAVDVVVLVDRTDAEYGETVNVTAQIFDRGALTDPSAVAAYVDRLPGLSSLNLTRQSVGVFTGVFVFRSHPSEVIVNATVDGTQDSGTAVVFHRRLPNVRVVPSVGVARPGESVSVEVDVSDANGPRDADSLEITADVASAPSFELVSGPTPLNWTHVDVGRYSVTYTVPPNLDQDAMVDFRAAVTLGTGGIGIGASVYVVFPDGLLIWYRSIGSGPSNATLLMYVASTAGVPLANAKVSLRYFDPSLIGSETLNGTTNSSGSARFELQRNASIPYGFFFGTASYGSLSQSFQGYLELPSPVAVGAPHLVRVNTDETFAPGETANLRFMLEQNGTGIPRQDLFVYVHTRTELVLAEWVSTDVTGEFGVRFIAPSEATLLEIAGFVGGAWRSFREGFIAENHLEARIASTDGRHLSITGRLPSAPGPWTAFLSLRGIEELAATPGPFAAAGNFGAARLAAGSAGETFAFDVQLPSFLPSGLAIGVSIEAMTFRWESGAAQFTFRQTVIVGAPIPQPTNPSALILLSGLAFLLAVFLILRRRRPPPKAEGRSSGGDEAQPEFPREGDDASAPGK